ncbi:hypothetical protein [Bradyrhizobium sp. RDM4]|uniref:hypothetical protein n=1 Tax=Bradyrhizobium sp. RDM4 TaxID=3378765 RepID=UPI0038FC9019
MLENTAWTVNASAELLQGEIHGTNKSGADAQLTAEILLRDFNETLPQIELMQPA